MSTTDFGHYLGERLDQLGLKPGKAGSAIGVLRDGRSFDATNIGKMLRGERRNYDALLVARMIQLFDLDIEKACWLADVNESIVRELLDRRDALTVTSLVAAGQAEMDERIAAGATHAADQAARRPRRARQRRGRPGGPERTNASNGGLRGRLRRPISPTRPRLHLVDQPVERPAPAAPAPAPALARAA